MKAALTILGFLACLPSSPPAPTTEYKTCKPPAITIFHGDGTVEVRCSE